VNLGVGMAWYIESDQEFEKSCRITLHPLGDFQFESDSCDRRLIKYAVEEVCDDPSGGMSVFLGDIEDNDRPSTRVRKRREFADRPEVLSVAAKEHLDFLDREIVPLLLPLANTKRGILGMLAGHHWTEITPTFNSVQYIAHQLFLKSGKNIPYLGQMSAWIKFQFRAKGRQRADITSLLHIQHGIGGGQTLASALNKLEMASRSFEANALIRAHDCKLVAAKFDRLGPKELHGGDPLLLSKTVTLLNVGSATRGYNMTLNNPDYVEQAMMRPTTLGWGKLHYNIRKSYAHEDPNNNWTVKISAEI